MLRLFVIILLLLPITAMAREFSFGYMPSAYSFSVDDPNGNTETETDVTFLGAVAKYDSSKDTRWIFDLSYYDFLIPPSTTNIGQTVETYQLDASRQHKLIFTKNIKIWAGYGLSFSTASYKNRHTIDTDGFLDQTFDDRDESEIGLALSIANEWKVNDFEIGLMARYFAPIDNGLKGFSIAVTSFF